MTRPPDALTEIRTLYYATTKATIVRDIDRAIDLLKGLPSDEEREKAAVYMDGLAQMRSEWGVKSPAPPAGRAKTSRPAVPAKRGTRGPVLKRR